MLQIDTKIFSWLRPSIPKILKIASLQCLYNISKKKLEIKLTFWMQINIKVSYKLISALLASKCSTRWESWSWSWWSSWWAWSSIHKVLKVTSLQCLYNISKKKFVKIIKIKTSQVGLSIFDKSSQTCPKYPKKEVC